MNESNDELQVMIEDGQSYRKVWLTRPHYNSIDGRYEYSSDDSPRSTSNNEGVHIVGYDPMRLKISASTGKLSMTLHRVIVEYKYNEDLKSSAIDITEAHVTSLITAN